MKISCNSTDPDNLHLCLAIQSCLTLCNLMDCSPPGTSVCGDSAGKNTGVGCHALLQGIYPIQGLNPGLPHCRWILYYLSHQGSPICTYMSSKLEMPLTRTWGFSRQEYWSGVPSPSPMESTDYAYSLLLT